MNLTEPTAPAAPAPHGDEPADTARPGARALVIAAHPDLRRSRVNRRLLAAAQALAAAGEEAPAAAVEVRDLYRLYPGFDLDVAAEQAALARADLIVWQHPIQWYAMPALMKLWLDEVFAHGWAYGRDGRGGRAGALAGKSLWLVVSTGAHEEAYRPDGYNRYFFDAFLPPYEQTAALCGLRFLPPLVVHGAHTIADAELERLATLYASRLRHWPQAGHWPELAELADCPSCVVPGDDRPDRAGTGPFTAAAAGADHTVAPPSPPGPPARQPATAA